jgi:hypothetical protein
MKRVMTGYFFTSITLNGTITLMDGQQPGQVISPGGDQNQPKPDSQNLPEQQVQPTVPVSEKTPDTPQEGGFFNAAQDQAEVVSTTDQGTAFTDESALQQSSQDVIIEWTASEFIAHNKSFGWYLVLILAAAIGSALVYLITGGDKTAVAVVIFAALVFGFYAGRQPKEQQYALGSQGVTIGTKFYGYHDFKSFSVVDEGVFSSISFMPMKRFMPIISIYFDPKDEENIVDVLSSYLPFDQHPKDLVDQFMKKIRF